MVRITVFAFSHAPGMLYDFVQTLSPFEFIFKRNASLPMLIPGKTPAIRISPVAELITEYAQLPLFLPKHLAQTRFPEASVFMMSDCHPTVATFVVPEMTNPLSGVWLMQ